MGVGGNGGGGRPAYFKMRWTRKGKFFDQMGREEKSRRCIERSGSELLLAAGVRSVDDTLCEGDGAARRLLGTALLG